METPSQINMYWVRALLAAGIDTTWSSIASNLLQFYNHDDDRQRLVAEL